MAQVALLPVVRDLCPYCGRFVSPLDIIPIGTGGAKFCLRCFEWHQKATRMLSMNVPWACQECNTSLRNLILSSPDGNVVFRVYAKDGIYQVLCGKCGDAYERKRLDLFGDTQYGWENKLKGSK